MEDKNRELLDKNIEDRLTDLDGYNYGCEAERDAIDSFEVLYKLRLEEKKLEQEADLKRAELRQQRIESLTNAGVAIGKTLLSMTGIFILGVIGYNFEVDNIVTSPTLKNVINMIKPPKD